MCNSRKIKNSTVQAKIWILFFSSLNIRNNSWGKKYKCLVQEYTQVLHIGLKDVREKEIFLYPNNF
jgi:hypothetical protein